MRHNKTHRHAQVLVTIAVVASAVCEQVTFLSSAAPIVTMATCLIWIWVDRI